MKFDASTITIFCLLATIGLLIYLIKAINDQSEYYIGQSSKINDGGSCTALDYKYQSEIPKGKVGVYSVFNDPGPKKTCTLTGYA